MRDRTGDKEPGMDDRRTTYYVYCKYRVITEFRSYNTPELEPDQLIQTAAKAADALGEKCHEKLVETGHVCGKMVVIRKVDQEKYEGSQIQVNAYSIASRVFRPQLRPFRVRGRRCSYCQRTDVEVIHILARSETIAQQFADAGTHGLCDECHDILQKYVDHYHTERKQED